MNSPGDTARYNAPASPPDNRASCEARKSPSGDCTARPLASRLVVTKEIHGFRHHAYRPAHSPPAPGSEEDAAGSRDRGEAVGRVPSQVERHLTGISLSSLVNVAKALGVPLGALIDQPRHQPDSYEGRRKPYALDARSQWYERLSTTFDGSQINALKVQMMEGYRSEWRSTAATNSCTCWPAGSATRSARITRCRPATRCTSTRAAASSPTWATGRPR